MFKSFQEYLDQNKKLVEKPKVSKIADFEGKQPSKPEKETLKKTDCGCSSGGKGQTGESAPYSNGQNAKDPNKDSTDALGHQGDKKLVYEPKVDEQPKEKTTWPKGMSEWLEKTKKMSTSEFTKKMIESNNSVEYDLVKEFVESCNHNKKNITLFLRESKRNNLLKKIIKEALLISESFEIISDLIKNESYKNKFEKLLKEMVAEPVGMEDMDSEYEDEDMEDMDGEYEDEDEDEEEDIENIDGEYEDEDEEEDMEDMEDMDSEYEDEEEDMEGMEDMDSEYEDEEEDMEDMEDMDGEYEEEDMEMGNERSSNPFMPKNKFSF